jgi:murein DD-endopeptidase MepM/ murein hydrolase activator NlpD
LLASKLENQNFNMKKSPTPYFFRPRTLALFFAISSCLVLYTILSSYHSIPDQIVHADSSCLPPPSGMVAWWHGENDANDSIGGNNGSMQNGATFAPGLIGQAFSFNGNFQFVSVPHSDSINPTTAMTVEAWVKINTDTPPQGWSVVNKDNPSPGPFDLRLLSGDVLDFGVHSAGFWQGALSAPNSYVPGVFFHVAGTFDASTGVFCSYINGAATCENTSGTLPFLGNTLKIGGDVYNVTYIDGIIDEVSLYNRALTASEIQAIVNAGSSGKCTSSTPTPTPTPINQPPVAGFTMTGGFQSATDGQTLNITAPTGPVPVNFSADRSSDPDGTVVAWEWTIDGNVISNASNFLSGLDIGDHTVGLIVTDDMGVNSTEVSGQISIKLPTPPPPDGFSIAFPLEGVDPYNAKISSILDHSGNGFYKNTNDSIDLAYTGELGDKKFGVAACIKEDEYANPSGSQFVVNGNYSGVQSNNCTKQHLSYNGHSGYDYAYGTGSVVVAPADGVLKIPADDPVNGESGFNSPWCKWHTIYIDHGNGYTTWFLHIDSFHDPLVNALPTDYCSKMPKQSIVVGRVNKGDPIAYVGDFAYGTSGGKGTRPHLHFEVRLNGKVIDPYGWEGISTDPFAAGKNKLAMSNGSNLWGKAVPTATQVTPSSLTTGSTSLTVGGSNFDNTAQVEIWYESDLNGARADSHFVGRGQILTRGSGQLVAAINLSSPGKYLVKIRNGAGPRSKPLRITVNP